MALINRENSLRQSEVACKAELARAQQLIKAAQAQYKQAAKGQCQVAKAAALQCMKEAEEGHRATLKRVRGCEDTRKQLEEEHRRLREGNSY